MNKLDNWPSIDRHPNEVNPFLKKNEDFLNLSRMAV